MCSKFMMMVAPGPIPLHHHPTAVSPPPQPGAHLGKIHAKTLDLEHNAIINDMVTKRTRLCELQATLTGVQSDINALEKRARNTLSDEEFAQLSRSHDARVILERDIDHMTNQSDDVGYYMRTANILFRYYDIIEKGNGCGGMAVAAPSHSLAVEGGGGGGGGGGGNNSILRYFMSEGGGKSSAPSSASKPAAFSPKTGNDEKKGGCGGGGDDRATLLDRYIQSARNEGPTRHIAAVPNHEHPSTPSRHTCIHCGKQEMTVMLQEGYVYCNACHTVEYVLVDHDKPSYKDPPKEVAYFAYKRINHLNEWLNQVQGKETTVIPDDVFDSILVEIKKQKLTNMAELTRKKVKDILKKLRINKYYEHVPHIINRLNGMPSPHMPPELEDRVRHMFCMIQVPFLKHSPSSRKNFLSYSYCLHKMMQLLEKDQYLDSFPLLKSREKLHQQDQIWQKICDDIGWDFIPSL